VSTTTTVFIDKLGRQFIRVDNVYIALRPDSDLHRPSPYEFDLGHFMFGTMLDLTMTPPTRSSAMIWCRIPTYITPVNDNRVNDFIAPPRPMLHFTMVAAVP
jgi:hypothetical protein